ncbi:MAG: hypothetical protein F2903_07075 [Actinobacteria bacterium]|uniref:Unannotated protein n=1 Tax=freshwater metagenome TaxID=449393 RepID=A0A6J7A7I4_9ZZZZ|nr:hypothetical protein [Actinomycetota bacterium]MSX10836.1 hypothetical protein [Actinomycetota bacterium]MSX68224.1 hypothetical protein [Actinomycetota bacterium]
MNPQSNKITHEDMENALKGFVDDSQESVVQAGTKAVGIASALGFLALALTYVFGRRRGSKERTVVEVRRI